MDLIAEIKEIAKKELTDCPAHNFEHVMRVYNMALRLAENQDVDLEVIKIACLLHDIWWMREMNDPTGNTDHAIESSKMAEPILKSFGIDEEKIRHIQNCIVTHRYRTWNRPESIEAKIVFDADKIESVGAIWIARAFSWIWKNNANIYKKADIEEYAKENLWGKINWKIQDKTKHSFHLMYETKDKFIMDFLYTEEAKAIAKERLEFNEIFIERLEKEVNWDG
ncbi:MAG: hypothetical protein ACD_2C00073G0036 [uncultured bacterium (gcode 4)]|uniref:HD domain-containing protein n=1 Tax=uncultured bacterium (gcode 4) TaxID=1234023 RepID=K2G3X1_9BACT|nr:MAG: hypothetical protein ACD_2C00073G0036 [uncultured bacterium (gcode 4)]